MTITAINGSAKGEASNSREVISILEGMLGAEQPMTVISQIRQYRQPDDSVFPSMAASDVLFIACALYVDALPASLMLFLERYAAFLEGAGAATRNKRQRVFAVVNCGFYEGVQNESALKILAHYCEYAGLLWSGGAGIGTGEMIRGIKDVPPQSGIRKPVIGAIKTIADAIAAGHDGQLDKNLFTQHGFPWFLYKIAGQFGWRVQAKAHGLKTRDLYRRPLDSSRR